MADKPPRPGTYYGDRGEHRRPQSQPGVPHEVPDEITGKYEGEDLVHMRSRRDTRDRVARLEGKHDELAASVQRTELAVAVVDEKTDGQTRLIEAMAKSLDRIAARDDVTFTAQVGVHQARAIDAVKSSGDKREWVTQALKLAGGIIAIAGAAFAAGRC